MARQFLTAIDLAKNELQNAAAHNLAAAPSSPVKGQLYMNTTDNTLYYWNGTAWVSAAGGALAYGNVVTETAFGQASANGVATSVARSDHTHGSPTHDNAAHSAINLSALAIPTAPVSFNSQRITLLGTPSAATDAATKGYVDNLIQGLSWKDSVKAASTVNVALTGTQTIDGVALVAQDRVLLKNQTAPAENGIWAVAAGAWTRATDADSEADLLAAAVFVEGGTTQADTAWVMTTNAPITVGTTGLTWAQFSSISGAVSTSRTLTAGAGLTGGGDLSADRTFDVGAGTGISVAADAVSLANMAANTLKGNNTGSSAAPTDLTATQVKTMLGSVSKYAVSFSGGTSIVVTHNLGTLDVIVQTYSEGAPMSQVECDVEHTSTNSVTVRFAVAPSTPVRIVVIG